MINEKIANSIILTEDTDQNVRKVKKLSNDIQDVKELKLGIYKVITQDNKKLLFKFSRTRYVSNSTNIIFKSIKNAFFRRNFRNEIKVNQILSRNNVDDFLYPRMLMHYKELIIFEYIEASKSYEPDQKELEDQFLELLFYLNFCFIDYYPPRSKIFNVLIEYILYLKYILIDLRKDYSLQERVSMYKLYFNLSVNHNSKYFEFGSHKDLQVNLLQAKNRLYVIDFESYGNATYLLEDVVLTCFNINEGNINRDIFKSFIQSPEISKLELSDEWIKNEVRLLLLRTSTRVMRSPSIDYRLKNKLKHLLETIIINAEIFEEWFNNYWK